jgi:NADH-quinone oxidoreductase subunit J
MAIGALAFYLMATIMVLSAVMVVSARHAVHGVLFLILAFFNAGGLFLLLGAEFLAMTLVIVYVGAVAVLFLFVVMMLDVDFAALRQGFVRYSGVAALIGAVIFVELLMLFGAWDGLPQTGYSLPTSLSEVGGKTNSHALGRVLYTHYALLFQAAGLILLVAMIGAIILTLRQRSGVRRQDIQAQIARQPEQVLTVRKVRSGEGV